MSTEVTYYRDRQKEPKEYILNLALMGTLWELIQQGVNNDFLLIARGILNREIEEKGKNYNKIQLRKITEALQLINEILEK